MSRAGERSALDDAFAFFTPEHILNHPRANGEGVCVAVVDSGVDQELIASRHPQGYPIRHIDYDKPSSAHGTVVADVILRLSPKVQIVSFDILGRGAIDVESVVNAIRRAINEFKARIVNLSLGISDKVLQQLPKRNLLYKAMEEAYYSDVNIVAAANNEHPFTLSYPASFGIPLLSVDKHSFDDPLQIRYEKSEKVEFQADGRGYLGPFSQELTTSWATPHLTAIAAKILSLKPDLKPFEVKSILYRLSLAYSGKSK